jgi:hypothetical protein
MVSTVGRPERLREDTGVADVEVADAGLQSASTTSPMRAVADGCVPRSGVRMSESAAQPAARGCARHLFRAVEPAAASAGVRPLEMRPRSSMPPLISSRSLIMTPSVLPQRGHVSGHLGPFTRHDDRVHQPRIDERRVHHVQFVILTAPRHGRIVAHAGVRRLEP